MSLWCHRDFMNLWSAETVSQVGSQVTLLALPLTAILVLRADAFELGLLGTAEYLPFILVGLPAGVWVGGRSPSGRCSAAPWAPPSACAPRSSSR